jgi:GTP pyrophosphokinase
MKEKLPVSRTKKKLTKQYAWVEELREAQREIANTNKFVETLKMDFFKDRVFVFTPNGDIIDLPEDSSVIDFAYAVHTDIGDHASGAHINGKFNAIATKLKNSDIVEIIVKKETVPSSKWLTFAKTTLARNKIQKYLKEHSLLSKFLSFGR